MNVNVSGPFIYGVIPLLGGIPVTQTMVSSAVVTVILAAVFVKCGKNLKPRPDGRQALAERGVSLLYELTVSSMGEHNARWAPFMGAIFLSSMGGTLIGMTGFLRAATADVSCTLVWALMITALIWYQNIRSRGLLGWLRGFTQPIPVMTPINLISELAQPISMAFRHFGNVAGGGVVTSIVYTAFSLASAWVLRAIASAGWLMGAALMAAGAGLFVLGKRRSRVLLRILVAVSAALGGFGLLQALGILSGVPVLAVGVPAVLSLYFDLFSGFVQALVFTLLSMVYLAGALPGETDAI